METVKGNEGEIDLFGKCDATDSDLFSGSGKCGHNTVTVVVIDGEARPASEASLRREPGGLVICLLLAAVLFAIKTSGAHH